MSTTTEDGNRTQRGVSRNDLGLRAQVMADGTLSIKRMQASGEQALSDLAAAAFWPPTEFSKPLKMLQCHEAKRLEFGACRGSHDEACFAGGLGRAHPPRLHAKGHARSVRGGDGQSDRPLVPTARRADRSRRPLSVTPRA